MNNQPHRRKVAHICPNCGHIRHLTPTDSAKTHLCRKCHCQQIAPLGFEATAKLYGRDFAIWAAARKRKQQPTTLEQQVEAALCQIPGIAWEREYAIERTGHNPYFVDFVVTTDSRRVALEVNGTFAHRHDDENKCLRTDTLFLFFDDVIVVTEAAIRQHDDLPHYLQQLLS
jgi:predicted AAA+ superfamily ATPase